MFYEPIFVGILNNHHFEILNGALMNSFWMIRGVSLNIVLTFRSHIAVIVCIQTGWCKTKRYKSILEKLYKNVYFF